MRGIFLALNIMGSYMSVHDDLPWIGERVGPHTAGDSVGYSCDRALPRQSIASSGVGGECDQGQAVRDGWNSLQFHDSSATKDWLGELAGQEALTFQWHGDTFSIPEGGSSCL
jgi:hypothetical protein